MPVPVVSRARVLFLLGSSALGLLLGVDAHAQPKSKTDAVATGATNDEAKAKDQARERFERGLALMKQSQWDEALTEFLASRKLYPTRGNTQDAAVCLRELGRSDESLELFESMLKEFEKLTAQERSNIEEEITRLRAKIGSVEVLLLEPGADVLVDGRARGRTPLSAPLRVSAGLHVVRVLKQGFSPFESRVEVEARKTVSVDGVLQRLTRSGQLKVGAVGDKIVDVLVDGVVVGKSPWQGAVAVGAHSVSVRGDGNLGSAPVAAKIRENEPTTLTLDLAPLESELRVEPVPINATVAIDGVAVGGGIWDSRLPKGDHRIEVAAEGFLPLHRNVSLDAGAREALRLELERDPESELWGERTPSHFVLDLLLAPNIVPLVGGELSEGCTGACSRSVGLGGLALLRGGYQFGIGIGLSVDAGYAVWHQNYAGRQATLTPRGLTANQGTLDDDLLAMGLLAGASASYQVGEDWPFQIRVGGGVFFGSMRDSRTGTFTTNIDPLSYGVGPIRESHSMTYAFVAPELRIGYRVADAVILSVAAQGVFLFALNVPEWADQQTLLAGRCDGSSTTQCEGEATFGTQRLTGGPIIFVTPGLALKLEL